MVKIIPFWNYKHYVYYNFQAKYYISLSHARRIYLNFVILLLGWDTDFATEVYKQQVEALAQHQV